MFQEIERRGLVLLGCGKMGSAMLGGWLESGLKPDAVRVLDPAPSDWLKKLGVHLNAGIPENPATALIAVKPQAMGEALPLLESLRGGSTLFISVAAGTPISALEAVLGSNAAIVRAMPNTPAAIGKGITAIVGNACADASALDAAGSLLAAVGQVVRLPDEELMDAVTAVSGSGPAYVFHLIEALAAAGAAEGLPEDLAMQLAKATVAGAGALASAADETTSQLRTNVTSPGGTTAAALNVLMDAQRGFPALLRDAVKAAADRSRELGA